MVQEPKLTPVFVEESIERFSELKLSDGTVILLKATPIAVFRMEGVFNEFGLPSYQFRDMQLVAMVKDCPAILKKENEGNGTAN